MTTGNVLRGLRSIAAVRSSARTHAFFPSLAAIERRSTPSHETKRDGAGPGKEPGSSASISVTAVVQDHPDGLQQDLDVEPRRPMAQILQIIAHPLRHLLQGLGLAAQSIDLGETRDSGPHLVADHVSIDELTVELIMSDGMRPRPDQAHLPLQHVQELRQLIEGGYAQESAHAGYPRVPLARLGDDRAVLLHPHGAELVDEDLLAVEA